MKTLLVLCSTLALASLSAAQPAASLTLNWTDNASNESGFNVERVQQRGSKSVLRNNVAIAHATMTLAARFGLYRRRR